MCFCLWHWSVLMWLVPLTLCSSVDCSWRLCLLRLNTWQVYIYADPEWKTLRENPKTWEFRKCSGENRVFFQFIFGRQIFNWFRFIILILFFFNFQNLVNPSFSKMYPFSILYVRSSLAKICGKRLLKWRSMAQDSLSVLHFIVEFICRS